MTERVAYEVLIRGLRAVSESLEREYPSLLCALQCVRQSEPESALVTATAEFLEECRAALRGLTGSFEHRRRLVDVEHLWDSYTRVVSVEHV